MKSAKILKEDVVKTIETHIQVTDHGELVLSPLPDLLPGEYEAVLVIQPSQRVSKRLPLEFPVDDLGPWPEELSLRREDLYGDDGR